jgi:hypothetical protein
VTSLFNLRSFNMTNLSSIAGAATWMAITVTLTCVALAPVAVASPATTAQACAATANADAERCGTPQS